MNQPRRRRSGFFTLLLAVFAMAALGLGFYLYRHGGQTIVTLKSSNSPLPSTETESPAEDLTENYQEEPAASSVPASRAELQSQPAASSALGGYDVLIADRGNNRLLLVTPDKQIIWQYQFALPGPGLGADDSFFADNGRTIITNLEEYQIIEQIDVASKQVVWSYGQAGQAGRQPGFLNTPDDAYKLPNGDVTVADIKNCRVLEISPAKTIVRQYGITGRCSSQPGFLDVPNGDTPLPDGHTFISNIRGHNLIELDASWQPIFSLPLPVSYPSDPQLTQNGNILVSDYSNPGQIVELNRAGQTIWKAGVPLNKPSLAIELPNGNILATDDYNHRVIVISKQTGQILWQYGVTGKPGATAGQLNVPDGLDIILPQNIPALGAAGAGSVGSVSRHAAGFLGQNVSLAGYVLDKNGNYVIISDEAGGSAGPFDLPVTGADFAGLDIGKKYLFAGKLGQGGLTASNGNTYHLDLTAVPAAANP